MWLDQGGLDNRKEASKILSKPDYVGADYEVIANSMTGTFEYEKGDKRSLPDFNVFFRNNATYPYYSDAVWYLSQMRRWGQISEYKSDDWYMDIAKKVYFAKETGFRPAQSEFIDSVTYDGTKPNAYLKSLSIGLKGKDKVK